MKSKKLLIISSILIQIVAILLIVLWPHQENISIKQMSKIEAKPLLKLNNNIEYLYEKDITIDNFKLYYNAKTKRYIISFDVSNTSESEIDLTNYVINVVDAYKNILCKIGGSALGKIPAKTDTTSAIEIVDDMSQAKSLEFVLKK